MADVSQGQALRRLLGPLRRAVTRTVPTPARAATLSDAQVELLRVLEQRGPSTVSELAVMLQIARPTVSNLVKTLHQQGMTTRELSATDFRSTLVVISEQARGELVASDDARAVALQRAINDLPEQDQAAITAAIPALEHLLARLREDFATD